MSVEVRGNAYGVARVLRMDRSIGACTFVRVPTCNWLFYGVTVRSRFCWMIPDRGGLL
jgi:hypothetical protein